MENRSVRLSVLIDPVKKEIFEEICRLHDQTPSQVIRQWVREFIHTHGSPEQVSQLPRSHMSR